MSNRLLRLSLGSLHDWSSIPGNYRPRRRFIYSTFCTSNLTRGLSVCVCMCVCVLCRVLACYWELRKRLVKLDKFPVQPNAKKERPEEKV